MTAPESLPEKIKQLHADFIDWFRDMELPMSDSAGRLFDAMDAIERAARTPSVEPAGAGEAAVGSDEWRQMFRQLALELGCLPSVFQDGNEHVFRKAKELRALKLAIEIKGEQA